MSPSNFSLTAVTTSCHEERRGEGRDSPEAGRGAEDGGSGGVSGSPHGQRLLTLREGSGYHEGIILYFQTFLLFFLLNLRERLWKRNSPVRGSQGEGSRVWNTRRASTAADKVEERDLEKSLRHLGLFCSLK